jgi:uncharacterized membrane protein YfcA
MDGILDRIVVFALVGVASGFASGLFGIGGGVIRIPFFLHLLPLFGVAQPVVMHVSIGTSMALILPGAVAATRKQIAVGNLDLPFFRTWAAGILIGGLVGALLVRYASTKALTAVFALFVTGLAIHHAFLRERMGTLHVPALVGPFKTAVAAATGCLSVLTGSAGGMLTDAVLPVFGIPLKTTIATASAGGLILGGIGTLGAVLSGWLAPGLPAFSLGYVDLVVFVAMTPVLIIAAPIGVLAGNRLSKTWLERSYTALLFAIAAFMLAKLITS